MKRISLLSVLFAVMGMTLSSCDGTVPSDNVKAVDEVQVKNAKTYNLLLDEEVFASTGLKKVTVLETTIQYHLLMQECCPKSYLEAQVAMFPLDMITNYYLADCLPYDTTFLQKENKRLESAFREKFRDVDFVEYDKERYAALANDAKMTRMKRSDYWEAVFGINREYANPEGFADVEKALQRYPNCFGVIYYSARFYSLSGLTQKNGAYSKKALSLYNRACMLIKQNEDPEISDISIRKEMAEIHLALGEYDKGVELLKQNNPCRMNHALIGQTLASSCNDPEGALPYLSMALLDLTVAHMGVVMGYLNALCKTKDYLNALALVDWALAFYPGLKTPEKRSYMDKNEAFLWAVRADIQLSLCKSEDAINSLREAKDIALRFDEAPNYSASSIRFVSCQIPATAFDDMGDTAMIGIDDFIASQEKSELLNLWRMVKDEE